MDMDALSQLVGEDLSVASYADIWVVLPDAGTLPLLGEARRLADSLGCYVHAVIADEALSERVIACGADRVHVTDVPGMYLQGQHPEFALYPVSRNAQAAKAAQKHRAGLISDARNLSIEDSTRALVGSHPVYGGEYFVDVAVTSAAKFATLDPRYLPEPHADPARSGELVPNDFAAPPPQFRDLGPVDFTPPAWRPLTKARVIVAAGRGVRGAEGAAEGFALVKQLAEKLGAELAGDRSARDSGWIDEAHEVGVTGVEVAPDLYVAVGIRGDTIHNAAIAGAKRVIAIHPSPDAPIFAVADECVVAEPKALLPQLLARLG
jgi:electron transfer flavoprotein alpha subunit